MDYHLYLTSLVALGLVIYSIIKWAIKGDIFHPGLVYSIINGGLYIVFVFGPYIYKPVPEIYYYMYVLIICVFVQGVILGNARGICKQVKHIKLKPLHLFIIYWLSVFFILKLFIPLVISVGGSLERGVEERFESINFSRDITNSNPLAFVLTGTINSLFQISITMVTAIFWQKHKYQKIALLALPMILYCIFSNSRTCLVYVFITIFIPFIIVLKEEIELKKLKKKKKEEKDLMIINKILLLLVILIILLLFMTNVRSLAIKKDLNYAYILEEIYQAKRKEKYFISQLSPELSDPILVLSLYAGGTVWFGGIATDIVIDYGLKTWGTRSINIIHRIMDRSGLDGGFANWARENYKNILAIGPYGLEFSWWGDPANFIVDYGLTIAPIAAITIGWIIGWMYGRISNGGIILKSTGTVIILQSIILTPAVSPFGILGNFINLSILGFYLLNNSYNKNKRKKIIYYFLDRDV